jgi:nitrite reductase/ring-hydroxylating ferredoxin subunit
VSENPARPKSGAFIARVSDLPEDGALTFDFVEGEARFSLIVAISNGEVYGFENVCPHAGYPLERPDGRVPMQDSRYLICSAHGASFDVMNGACVGGPGAGRGLSRVPLKRKDDYIIIA